MAHFAGMDFETVVFDLLAVFQSRHVDVAVVGDAGAVEYSARGHLIYALPVDGGDVDAALIVVGPATATEVILRGATFVGASWGDDAIALEFADCEVRLSLVPSAEPLSDWTLSDLLKLHGTAE